MEKIYFEDRQLVHKYLAGDMEAGHELYSKIYEAVKNYIFYYTNKSFVNFNEEDKKEILQETFLESVKKLSLYNGKSQFKTYVIGIARNKILEKQRAVNRLTEKEISEQEISIVDKETLEVGNDIGNLYGIDPLNILINKETQERISTAINSLSPDHKMIIQLRLNNMKFKQISEQSGKSEKSLQQLYRRALNNLKENLK